MFEAATSHPACYGARMTGGGFGGCTVNLVAAEGVDAFCAEVDERYRRATGLEPSIFVAQATDGLSVTDLPA
jgi:galactokinase